MVGSISLVSAAIYLVLSIRSAQPSGRATVWTVLGIVWLLIGVQKLYQGIGVYRRTTRRPGPSL